MNEESKAFHLYFSVVRDIIADEQKAKLITTKIVDEIIESHMYNEYTDDISKNLKYWFNVKQKITKL
jgi:hypothetical protein